MQTLKKYPLISFFTLAYLITWTLQLSGIWLAGQSGIAISNEDNLLHFINLMNGNLNSQQTLAYLTFSLGMGPLFSAIIMTALLEGKSGLQNLWQRSTHWQVGWKWLLTALAIPLGLSLASVGLGALLGGGLNGFAFKLEPSLFIPFFIYMFIFTGIAEEPGWRGFALPRLQSQFTAAKSSWILGILWGVWHFPFIIYYNYALGFGPLIGSLIGLTLGIVGWTMVNTWLYNNTRSVFLLILLHAWGNTIQSYLVLSSNNYLAQTLYGVLPWAIAIYLSKKYGDENLSPNPRPKA